jgi:photosystem I P700 chlorophyll a apoprotein A2
MKPRAAILVGLLAAHLASLGAPRPARDPDSPETQAAAQAALARAKILDIVGVTGGIEGLLKDLDARVAGPEIRIALSADVLFDFDSSTLRPAAAETLHKVAEVLRQYGRSPVSIEGHTDAKGSDAYNQTLSERRADSVKKWLVNPGGISPSRMTTAGWGKRKPVAPNTKPDGSDDPEGRQKNRRVEITLKREG